MIMRQLFFVFLALIVILPSLQIDLQAEPVRIKAGVPADFPPNFSRDPQTGKPSGFAVEVLNEVARTAGYEVEYHYGKPWDELQDMLLSGKIDVIPSLIVSNERKSLFAFTQPIEVIPVAWMVRVDSILTDYKKGLQTGVITGSAAEDRLKADGVGGYKAYESLQELLFALLSGHVDIVLAPTSNIRRLALDAGVADKIRFLSPPLMEAKRGIALCPGNDELRKQLDRTIIAFVGTPKYQAIYNKWWSKPPSFWTVRKVITLTTALILALGTGMVWWRYRDLKLTNRALSESRDELHQQTVLLEQEIAERQKLEEALAQDRDYLQTLFEHGGAGHLIVSSNRLIVRVNHQICTMLGYEDEELIGKSAEILHIDRQHYEAWAPVFKEAGTGKTRSESEYPLRRKDNSSIWCLLTGVRLLLREGEIGVVWSIVDISERKLAEQKLQEEEGRIKLLLHSVAEGIVGINASGNCVMANPAAVRMLGFRSEKDLIEKNFHQICHHTRRNGDTYPETECPTAHAMHDQTPTHCDQDLFWRPDGSSFSAEYWSHPMLEGEQVVGAVVAFTDISERMLVEERVRKLSHGLQHSASAAMITDINGAIEYVNAKFTSVTGYSSDEAIGQKPSLLKSGETSVELFQDLWNTILAGKEWRGELRNRRKNGEVYWSFASISPLFDDSGAVTHFIANVEDISERKNAEATIEHLAFYDPLTNLPNRRLLQDRLSMALKRSRRQGKGLALLYLDLDRFKNINDTFGHPVGDKLLKELACRFSMILRDDDVICRLGGDEFAILLHDTHREEQIASVANKLLYATSKPVLLEESELVITASIGIALCPKDALDAETLIKHADIALYHAKALGKNTFSFFVEELNVSTQERMKLETALRTALERKELKLYYQPKIQLATGRVSGVEALLRWDSPVFGTVSPVRFIPVAEETNLIISIGEWVLQEACMQQVAWKRAGLDLKMAINLSSVQFRTANLIERITEVIDRTGVATDAVELELTESALVDSPKQVEQTLTGLRELGFGIAIDDFGTGYSSLSYLRNFPVTVLKIDRSFVRDIAFDSGARAVAQTVVDLATNLNMETVAEGVETSEQLDILRKIGCHQVQGFYYAKPMPAEKLVEATGDIMKAINRSKLLIQL